MEKVVGELLSFIENNKLGVFGINEVSGSFECFKTRDAKAIASKTLNKISDNFIFYPTRSLLNHFIFIHLMKILQILLIAIVLVACNCDPVDCVEVQNSVRGYYSSCTSTHPWPLKVMTTVKLMQNYTFTAAYSWKFYLRNYKGETTVINNCGLTNPSNGPRIAGA